MALHQSSGRWRLGLALALTTAALWSTLPLALKVTLERVDALTLTWARFAFAALVTGIWLIARGQTRAYRELNGRGWALLALAAIMLIGNYLLYLLGLQFTTPANAQLLIQLAPLLMALGGIWVFRERFNAWQWLGLIVIALGLGLFFSDQVRKPLPPGTRYLLGAACIVIAAAVWAVYALAQKQLLARMSSTQVMGFIYLVASLVLLPVAHPLRLLELDWLHGLLLAYCAINTLGAYGAFAEALAHWEASRVSTVLALTPLLTVGCVAIAHAFAPSYIRAEQIAWAGWLGAGMVVTGSALSSLMRDAPAPPRAD